LLTVVLHTHTYIYKLTPTLSHHFYPSLDKNNVHDVEGLSDGKRVQHSGGPKGFLTVIGKGGSSRIHSWQSKSIWWAIMWQMNATIDGDHPQRYHPLPLLKKLFGTTWVPQNTLWTEMDDNFMSKSDETR